MRRNDKSTLFLMTHFQYLGPWDTHRVKIQRSLTSLQTMFNHWSPQILNLNHQKITYFCHYIPWSKIPEDMKKSIITTKDEESGGTVELNIMKGKAGRILPKRNENGVSGYLAACIQPKWPIPNWYSGFSVVSLHFLHLFFFLTTTIKLVFWP